MKFFKGLGRYLLKGLLYSIAFAVIGVLFSFVKNWPVLKGTYIFVLGGGVVTMFVSVMMLIGTPKMRKEMFFDDEKRKDPNRGGEGIGPAFMGVMMIVIGFWLESLMH